MADSRTMASSEPLTQIQGALRDVLLGLEQLSTTLSQLTNVQQNLTSFNDSFGRFIGALELNASCQEYAEIHLPVPVAPHVPAPAHKTPIRKTEQTPARPPASSRRTTRGLAQKSKVKETASAASAAASVAVASAVHAPPPPPKVRQALFRNALKLPPKYAADPAHLERIEIILAALASKPSGLRLSELVAICNFPMLQTNEYLNLLTRLNEVTRTKQAKGMQYKLNKRK